MADKKIGGVYVEVRLNGSNVKKEMEEMKKGVSEGAKTIEAEYKRARIDFDTRIAKMRIDELKSMHKALTQQLENKIRLGADDASLERTTAGLDAVRNRLQQVKREGENSASSLSSAFLKTATILTGYFSIGKMASFTYDAAKQAAQIEELGSYYRGTTRDIELFKKATAETIDDDSLIQLSNQATELGISLKDQPVLFLMAKKAAAQFGGDVERGFEKIIRVSEGMTRGLYSLGIETKQYNQRVKELAKSHGDTIENLDGELQKRIRLQALLEASGLTLKDVENKQQSLNDKVKSFSAHWQDAKQSFGSMFLELLDKMPVINKMLENLSRNFKEVAKGRAGLSVENTSIKPVLDEIYKGEGSEEEKKKKLEDMANFYKKEYNLALEQKARLDKIPSVVSTPAGPVKADIKIPEIVNTKDGPKTVYKDLSQAKFELEQKMALYSKSINEINNYEPPKKEKDEFDLTESQKKRAEQIVKVTNEAKAILTKAVNDYLLENIDTDYGKNIFAAAAAYKAELKKIQDEAKTNKGFTKEAQEERRQAASIAFLTAWDKANREANKKALDDDKKSAAERVNFEKEYNNWSISNNKEKNDELIRGFRLTNDEYEKYLNEQLELERTKYEEQNRRIRQENKKRQIENAKNGTNLPMLPEFNIDDILKGKKAEIPFKLKEYSGDKKKEDRERLLKEYAKDHQYLAKIAEMTGQEISSAFDNAFSLMIEKEENFVNAMTQAFGNMARSIIAQILEISAKWLLIQGLTALNPAGGGFLGFLTKNLGGHEGGEFEATATGVKKLSGNGSVKASMRTIMVESGEGIQIGDKGYKVPEGYPNDSYPLMLPMHEKVTVIPAKYMNVDPLARLSAGGVIDAGIIKKLQDPPWLSGFQVPKATLDLLKNGAPGVNLSNLERKLDVLNSNILTLIAKGSAQTAVTKLESEISGNDIRLVNKKAEKISRRIN